MVGVLCGKLLFYSTLDTLRFGRQEIRLRCILKYDSPLMTVSYSLIIHRV